MEINLITETVKFLILGMTTVFAFLTLLVCVMYAQGKIISKYFPHPEGKNDTPQSSKKCDTKSVIAVIATALYMRKQK